MSFLFALKGRQGDTGDKGDEGDKGDKGDKGDQGEQGSANYVHRGNPDSSDFTVGDLTIDGSWHDLDLSAIIPENTKLVLLKVAFNATQVGKWFYLKKKGDTHSINRSTLVSIIVNKPMFQDILIQPDDNRLIEYAIAAGTSATINITVSGWFVAT